MKKYYSLISIGIFCCGCCYSGAECSHRRQSHPETKNTDPGERAEKVSRKLLNFFTRIPELNDEVVPFSFFFNLFLFDLIP